jgi:hypothetical protein
VAEWLGGAALGGAAAGTRSRAAPPGAAAPLSLLGSAHPRSADLVVTFAGSEDADEWGLPGHAPFDAPDVPEGGGMHGGLHRAELATVLVLNGGPVRRGAVVQAPCDLTDIAPTVLHLSGLDHAGMEGHPLHDAWTQGDGWRLRERGDPAAARLRPRSHARGRGGRLYPTALRRA